MAAPKRIHTVTQGYQRNFACSGQLLVHDVRTGRVERKQTHQVAMRLRWWGSDAVISDAAERSLLQCEDPAVALLRGLVHRWPLSRNERAIVAQFVAIHVVRSPAWDAFYVRAATDALQEVARDADLVVEGLDGIVKEFLSHRTRIDTMMEQIPRLASLLCSMHWSLVAFDGPLLASCDHPVVPIPLMPAGETRPISAVPATGYMATSEIRFPVSPRLLLLLTWLDGDRETEPLRGDFRHAADINRSTYGQAERHWFHHPLHHAPRQAPPLLNTRACQPVGFELLDDYTLDTVMRSGRRKETDRIMHELMASGQYDVMRWVRVDDSSSAAEAA